MPTSLRTPHGVRAAPTVRRLAIPLICVAQLMATLDVTIVNLALPQIQTVLGLSNAGLAWVVDAYTLAYAGLLLLGGRTGDVIGHRRTLMIGIALFTLASLAAGLAPTAEALLAARAGQGIGAALATPTTLSLITTLTRPGEQRTRAMVAYGAMAGLGITLGLVLGGVLTELASWRWVFLLNVPIGTLVLLAAPRVLPESRGVRRRIDVAGALTGTVALTGLVFGVIRAGTHHWGEAWSVASLVGSALLLGLFVLIERHTSEPMLPLRLLRHRVRVGAYLVAALLFACLYPAFFLLSRTLQDVQGHGPIGAGLRFLPIGLGVLVFAVVTRRLMAISGPRPLVVGGTLATTAAAASLLSIKADSPYLTLLLPCLIGLGAGVGTTFVANAALAMTDVPETDAGVGSGLLSTFQAVGGTIGVAALAAVAADRTESRLAGLGGSVRPEKIVDALLSGFSISFALAAVLSGLAVLVAAGMAPAARSTAAVDGGERR